MIRLRDMPSFSKMRTILKVKEKKIQTILNPDSCAVSELQQGRGKAQEGQNVKRVNRRVWVTEKCLSFMWTFGLRFTGQIL